jgi:hypothetical protein
MRQFLVTFTSPQSSPFHCQLLTIAAVPRIVAAQVQATFPHSCCVVLQCFGSLFPLSSLRHWSAHSFLSPTIHYHDWQREDHHDCIILPTCQLINLHQHFLSFRSVPIQSNLTRFSFVRVCLRCTGTPAPLHSFSSPFSAVFAPSLFFCCQTACTNGDLDRDSCGFDYPSGHVTSRRPLFVPTRLTHAVQPHAHTSPSSSSPPRPLPPLTSRIVFVVAVRASRTPCCICLFFCSGSTSSMGFPPFPTFTYHP